MGNIFTNIKNHFPPQIIEQIKPVNMTTLTSWQLDLQP